MFFSLLLLVFDHRFEKGNNWLFLLSNLWTIERKLFFFDADEKDE
jgi:hypothetical protein